MNSDWMNTKNNLNQMMGGNTQSFFLQSPNLCKIFEKLKFQRLKEAFLLPLFLFLPLYYI